MRIEFRYAAALLFSLAFFDSTSRGVTLNSIGSQYDIGGTFFPGGTPPYVVVPWRSDINTKTLDADANNVYGSAGYALFATQFNWPNVECCGSSVPFNDATYPNMISLPSFVTASQNLTTNKVGGWVYSLIDDPELVNGYRDYNWGDTLIPSVGDLTGQPNSQSPYVKLGIVDGGDIFGNDPKTSAFGAGRWAFEVGAGVPNSFRVGVMTDGLDANQWAATEVLIARVSGSPVPTIVGTPVSSGALTRNRFVDMHFFDIVGAQPGDQFAIFAKASADGNGAISAVTFDVPAAVVVPGDFNANGVVDAADYVLWRANIGSDESVLNGAGDGSGTVDPGDYSHWRARFGNTSGAGSELGASGVPEPTTLMLILGFAALLPGLRAFPRGCPR